MALDIKNIKTTHYYDELVSTMRWLGEQSNTIFIGQSVKYDGHMLFKSMVDVPVDKRIELPVSEDFQMGQSTGLAIEGFVPISIYPRFDFLLLTTNQLFNHLDNFAYFTKKEWIPKVIIRTSVGSVKPLDPGVQHKQDYSEAFKLMRKEINIVQLTDASKIREEYEKAYCNNVSTILIEYADLYREFK